MSRLHLKRLRRISEREDGSLTIFALVIFVTMLIAGGMAVDFMRFESKRAILQSTLDSAVLAAADLDQELDAESVVLDYFARSGIPEDQVHVEVEQNLNGREVSALATIDVNTYFIKMIGIEELEVAATGAARELIPHVEISLILDISGSMRFGGKMGNLKDAATEFVSATLREDVDPMTSINVVPYAGQVNPGPEVFELLGGVRLDGGSGNYFPEWPQDISNIVVYFDRDGNGTIDAAGKVEGFPDSGTSGFISNDPDDFLPSLIDYIRSGNSAFDGAEVVGASIKGGRESNKYFEIADNTNGSAEDVGPTDNTGRLPYDETAQMSYDRSELSPVGPPIPSSCLELASTDFEYSGLPSAGSYDQVPHFMNWAIADSVMDWGWCPEDDTAIQYARNNEAELHTFIRNIRMHDGTGTHYGMKYGLALLDPGSRAMFGELADLGLVPADFSERPSNWREADSKKYIVLMTDGQITDQYRPDDPLASENATVELNEGRRDERVTFSSRNTNVTSFYMACDLAKANGVTVYTIAYEAPSNARREMRNCASSINHYFDVEGRDITEAFAAIAGQINQLRLTQ